MGETFRGFERFIFSNGKWRRPVYRTGNGPGVIVIHEIPGLHPLVLDFARKVAEAGMTVYCPSLFGEPGKPASMGYAVAEVIATMCVRREFNVWANGRSSPIVDWLRALARKVHQDCGGRGVGAVGMCLTGGFALAMMTEPAVVAPVLSQPSLPFGKKGQAKIDCSASELSCAASRFDKENLSLLGLRFKGDVMVPDARFEMLKETFGPRFEAIELDPSVARQGTGQPPHSVLTIHLDRSDPLGPTMKARDRVIQFFKEKTGA